MSKRADGVLIRFARPDERIALEGLMRRASLALGEYNAQLEAHPDAIEVPAEQIERDQVIVAELDGLLAGFAAVVEGELDGLFVEPAMWKRGIGAALVQEATHMTRRLGLSLSVIANPSVREFYEKCGFTLEGQAVTRFGPALRMSR